MKRLATIASIALAIFALAGTASALDLDLNAGVVKKPAPPPPSNNAPNEVKQNFWDAGVDIGLPVVGYLGLGSLTLGHGAKVDMSGTGTVSFPYLGAHFSLYPSPTWYIQFGLGWLRQEGTLNFGTVHQGNLSDAAYQNEKDAFKSQTMDWGLNSFKIDAGIFKLFGSSQIVRPKAGIGVGIYYLSFFDRNHQPNDTWNGWTVGPFGVIGVDFDVYHNRKVGTFFVGLNARLDLVYTISDLAGNGTHKGSDASLLWTPLSLYGTIGFRF
jgi:hypothetical protein